MSSHLSCDTCKAKLNKAWPWQSSGHCTSWGTLRMPRSSSLPCHTWEGGPHVQAALPCFQLVLVVEEHHVDPGNGTVLRGDRAGGGLPCPAQLSRAQGLHPRDPRAKGHPECPPAEFSTTESTRWHRALAKAWGVLGGAEWHQTLPTKCLTLHLLIFGIVEESLIFQ